MRRGRDISRRGLAAPQALAVLSCALALLIAHPAGVRADAVGSTRVAASTPVPNAALVAPQGKISNEATTPPARTQSRTFFASARRLHILATVEILHRMLLSELRPTERPLAVGINFAFATLCVFEPPIEFSQHFIASSPGEPSVERTLVRLQCQLAPPAL